MPASVSSKTRSEDKEAIAGADFNDSGEHYMPPVAFTRNCFVAMHLAIFLNGDGDLPCAAGAERAASLIHAIAFVGELGGRVHRRHSHRRHRRHVERDRDICSSNGSSICTSELHPKDYCCPFEVDSDRS